jgi:hypothetical protein
MGCRAAAPDRRHEVSTVPAWAFLKTTVFNDRSPACCWRHPRQAARIFAGAAGNLAATALERATASRRRHCPVCRWSGLRFRTFLSADEIIPNSICPVCGSFDRHRQLVLGVREELAAVRGDEPRVLLGFSLSSAMRYLLEHEGLRRCFRSDVEISARRFDPDLVTDLRRSGIRTGSVDWVFCSHVLEHVDELELCTDELVRILRPGGIAWIQVPLEPDLDRSRRIPVDPHRAHAHAWRFGRDFPKLIARPAWTVSEIRAAETLAPDDRRRWGITADERYWRACRELAR